MEAADCQYSAFNTLSMPWHSCVYTAVAEGRSSTTEQICISLMLHRNAYTSEQIANRKSGRSMVLALQHGGEAAHDRGRHG